MIISCKGAAQHVHLSSVLSVHLKTEFLPVYTPLNPLIPSYTPLCPFMPLHAPLHPFIPLYKLLHAFTHFIS